MATRTPSLRRALREVGTVALFGVAPIVALSTMLVIGLDTDSIAADFHHELYPQTEEMLAGRNPYPSPDWDPTAAPNFIWPPAAAALAAPLTLLPLEAADIVIAALGLVVFALSLWLVGVRDWRVYGATGLWPQVAGEMRVSHLTPFLCLLAAIAWRSRNSTLRPGLAIGVGMALKLFVWPLTVWLLAIRRTRAALVAVGIAVASLLAVAPFTGIDEYVRALLQLSRAFDQDSYTVFGLLVQLDVPEPLARGANLVVGLALLAGVWRYRSFALAIAASLVLSPIVWLDYFALAAVPLAIARPRLSLIWLAPLLTWGAAGAGQGIGEPLDQLRVLAVFALVLAVASRARSEATWPMTSPGRAG